MVVFPLSSLLSISSALTLSVLSKKYFTMTLTYLSLGDSYGLGALEHQWIPLKRRSLGILSTGEGERVAS